MHRTAYVYQIIFKIDIRPPQTEYFATSETAVNCYVEEAAVFQGCIFIKVLQKPLRLLYGQYVMLCRRNFRERAVIARIYGYLSNFDRICEYS